MQRLYRIVMMSVWCCCTPICGMEGEFAPPASVMDESSAAMLANALCDAVKDNRMDSLRTLLSLSGVTKMMKGCALKTAAELCCLDALKILLASGTLPEDCDQAMILAARKGNKKAVSYLVRHGAYVDAVDEGNRTALMYAVCRGSDTIVAYLLRKGANPNIRREGYPSPFSLAVMAHKTTIAKKLLQHGADVDAVGDPGISPREWAVLFNYVDLIALIDEYKMLQQTKATAEAHDSL